MAAGSWSCWAERPTAGSGSPGLCPSSCCMFGHRQEQPFYHIEVGVDHRVGRRLGEPNRSQLVGLVLADELGRQVVDAAGGRPLVLPDR